MLRLTKDERADIIVAFEKKYKTDDDPNIDVVCMRYPVYDGDYIEVKAHEVGKCNFPHIVNGCNVFVEKTPHTYFPVG